MASTSFACTVLSRCKRARAIRRLGGAYHSKQHLITNNRARILPAHRNSHLSLGGAMAVLYVAPASSYEPPLPLRALSASI